jgi:GGDEF domain-containing protein
VELRDPPPTLVTDLADRLAYVCARITEASLSAPIVDPPGRAGPLADVLAATPADAEPEPAPPPEGEAGPDPDAVLVPDDPPPPPGVQVVSMPADPSPDISPPYVVPREPARDAPAAEVYPEPEPVGVAPPLGAVAVPQPGGTPIVTRLHPGGDAWAGDAVDAPPWLAAITRRLERRAQDGLPFAVLVVEVDDLDRLLASEPGREVAFALEVAERALTAELAPADLVVRERLGRWWLTSPDRDADAARDLGTRVAEAIGAAVLGGAALRASIGVAVCPYDGDAVDALASRADQGMFAARAAGVPVA